MKTAATDLIGNIFIISRIYDGHFGGIRNIKERIDAFQSMGFHVFVIYNGGNHFTTKLSDRNTLISLPGIFDVHPSRYLSLFRIKAKRKDVNYFFSLINKLRPCAIMVHGEHPSSIYLMAQEMAPLYFFRHDGILTCPGGAHFLWNSCLPCKCSPSLKCLRVDRKEGCLGSGGLLSKFGRIILRKFDLYQLLKIKNFVANSRYIAVAHGFPKATIQYPPLRKPDELPLEITPQSLRYRKQIAFVGRLDSRKGALEAVEILNYLPKGYRLVIIGDGHQKPEVEKKCSSLKERVIFRGWLDSREVLQVLSKSEVTIVPSLCDEAFGIVGVESYACGTPVVAYDVGGISEWCIPPAGICVECGDKRSAAEAIQMICENNWPARSKIAREYALKEFDYNRFLESLKYMVNLA